MKYFYWLACLAIPAALAVHFAAGNWQWQPVLTFALAGIGIVPLARLMGESTEALAERAGPTWGGLLNATFGNAAELIIAIIALTKGLLPVVHASLTGSILGNLLLVAGGAQLAGGLRHPKQSFNENTAETNAGLLTVAVAAMLFPAIYHLTAQRLGDPHLHADLLGVSIGTSIILLVVYALGLLFTLKTHAKLFSHHGAPAPGQPPETPAPAATDESWSVSYAVLMLLLATAGIAILSELLVGAAEATAHHLGLNDVFIGVILLAIIGNAAEHSTALMLALKDDMDTAMMISYQSSVQIALFVTPVLVLLSYLLHHFQVGQAQPLTLLFSPMEVIAVVLTVFIVVILAQDGETNWFEGALLLGMYGILAIAFFYIPAGGADDYTRSTQPATAPAALEPR